MWLLTIFHKKGIKMIECPSKEEGLKHKQQHKNAILSLTDFAD